MDYLQQQAESSFRRSMARQIAGLGGRKKIKAAQAKMKHQEKAVEPTNEFESRERDLRNTLTRTPTDDDMKNIADLKRHGFEISAVANVMTMQESTVKSVWRII